MEKDGRIDVRTRVKVQFTIDFDCWFDPVDQKEKARKDKITSRFWFENSLSYVDELILVILGEHSKLSAQCDGVIVLALIRFAAGGLHYVCVYPGSEK